MIHASTSCSYHPTRPSAKRLGAGNVLALILRHNTERESVVLPQTSLSFRKRIIFPPGGGGGKFEPFDPSFCPDIVLSRVEFFFWFSLKQTTNTLPLNELPHNSILKHHLEFGLCFWFFSHSSTSSSHQPTRPSAIFIGSGNLPSFIFLHKAARPHEIFMHTSFSLIKCLMDLFFIDVPINNCFDWITLNYTTDAQGRSRCP